MKRFAFYGRVSTEDQQDPASSRNWQLARSRQIIEGHGEVVTEFFDIGQSRSLPWKRRPEAARLLDAFRDPDRGFDAVVVGEPQRALRQPVRAHVPGLHPLRRRAVGARGRRPRRPRLGGSRHGHVALWRHEQGRADANQDPGAHGDGRAGLYRRPLPRRSPALRLPTRRRGPTPESVEGSRRAAASPPRNRPDRCADRAAHLHRVRRWPRSPPDRRRPQPRRCPLPLRP